MNEAYFTRKINGGVDELDPSVVVWKLSDRFNAGRPDCHYLKRHGLYVEYKFARVKKLPTRHKPTCSPIQLRELQRLHNVQPQYVRVIVGFEIEGTRALTFVEYTSPSEWEQSTVLSGLRTYIGYRQVAEHILFLIN